MILLLLLCFSHSQSWSAEAPKPKRVVSLLPSNTEIVYELGLGDRLVGVTSYCDYPKEAEKKEKVGDFIHPNFEKIVSLKPDIVLAGVWKSTHIVPRLREAGIDVVEIKLPATLDDIYDTIIEIARVLERPEEGKKLVEDLRKRVDKVTAKAGQRKKIPSVYIEIDPPNWTISKLSFINDAVERCGARNIFRDVPVSGVQVSWETVFERDPDVMLIFSARKKEIALRPGWSKISAVKNGRIIDSLGRDFLNRPTPRLVQGMEQFSDLLAKMGY